MICNVYRTRWGNNSSTRGSYSFIKVGASMTDIDLLAEPLTDSETEKVSPGGRAKGGAEGITLNYQFVGGRGWGMVVLRIEEHRDIHC